MKILLSVWLFVLSSTVVAETAGSPAMAAGEHDAVLNGVRLHYTVSGSGPVMVAHSGGPGMDARTWGDLAGLDSFATVVVLHPRGSGLSGDPPDGAYSLADYAADIDALRQHLGLDDIALLGWSHGGMVAMQYAASYPAAVSRLILYSTAAYLGEFLEDIDAAVQRYRDQPWFDDAYAALQDEWAGNYSSAAEMSDLLLRELKFYFHQFDHRAAAYLDSIRPYDVRIAPLKAFNANEAPQFDLRPMLANITAPTLVLAGRSDFITTVAMAEEIVRHTPHARLVVFERSGHFAVVEEAPQFHQVIEDFLAE
jgi:proline iminopeptidase